MILPNKHLSEKRCILRVGGEILKIINNEGGKTISQLWKNLDVVFEKEELISFDWFILSLNFLYMCDFIAYSNNNVVIK